MEPLDLDDGSSLAGVTAAELHAAGRLATAAGRAAMVAAEYLDGASRETGSGVAALLKAHRDAMAEALKNAPRQADGLDELGDRRARKAAGA